VCSANGLGDDLWVFLPCQWRFRISDIETTLINEYRCSTLRWCRGETSQWVACHPRISERGVVPEEQGGVAGWCLLLKKCSFKTSMNFCPNHLSCFLFLSIIFPDLNHSSRSHVGKRTCFRGFNTHVGHIPSSANKIRHR
jgi:hypothetical protein